MSAKSKPAPKPKVEAKPTAKVETITCPECAEMFTSKPKFRGHMLSAHIVANREKYGDTVLKILKEQGKLEKEDLMVKSHERNPAMSKLGHKTYGDAIAELKKAGKVTVKTVVELVKE